jgi:glycosyltransferase involved in cell wall biosynthesis
MMRIAQVSPLYESVPPQLYGGTERVVSYLTEELVRQGHEVTLFASGDSRTAAELVPACERALRLDPKVIDGFAHHVLQLERVQQRAAEFDVIHYHVDYAHFPFSRRCLTPSVTTLHGRLDLPDLAALYREFADMPLVSISDAQRAPLPDAGWVATVQHGLPPDLYPFSAEHDGYLAFLGRISPEKRVDRAIQIAGRVGLPLKIAAKVDRADEEYFVSRIEPMLGAPGVELVGEIGDAHKGEFLGRAAALLFPIDWPEPFGLTMIEAMACGTPVVAFRRGSVPEVMAHGESGWIVESIEGACRALERLESLPRERCRRVFEERYTARRMAADYLAVYAQIISRARSCTVVGVPGRTA